MGGYKSRVLSSSQTVYGTGHAIEQPFEKAVMMEDVENANHGRRGAGIDLKSFYASSECVEHGFPPLSTHLVVADQERTDKTICLAISPSLKAYGLPGRARLFEVKAKLKEINAVRRAAAPGGVLTGKSYDAKALAANPNLAADVFIAKPRMSHYLAMSAKIYGIYLKYVSAEDIHVYSVDEVFIFARLWKRGGGDDP